MEPESNNRLSLQPLLKDSWRSFGPFCLLLGENQGVGFGTVVYHNLQFSGKTIALSRNPFFGFHPFFCNISILSFLPIEKSYFILHFYIAGVGNGRKIGLMREGGLVFLCYRNL